MSHVSAMTSQVTAAGENAKGGLRGHFFASTLAEQVFHGDPSHVHDETDLVMADKIDRPSIRFHPSWEDYEARSKFLAVGRSETVKPCLPEGFPASIEGSRAWSARNLSDVSELIEVFCNDDVQELEAALAHFKGRCGAQTIRPAGLS